MRGKKPFLFLCRKGYVKQKGKKLELWAGGKLRAAIDGKSSPISPEKDQRRIDEELRAEIFKVLDELGRDIAKRNI